jgi:hypothetical protein
MNSVSWIRMTAIILSLLTATVFVFWSMTLYEFRALSEIEQQQVMWNGIHIADRLQGDHRIVLYQMDSFYIEVFYNKQNNHIDSYRAFCSKEQLKPYLNQLRFSLN